MNETKIQRAETAPLWRRVGLYIPSKGGEAQDPLREEKQDEWIVVIADLFSRRHHGATVIDSMRGFFFDEELQTPDGAATLVFEETRYVYTYCFEGNIEELVALYGETAVAFGRDTEQKAVLIEMFGTVYYIPRENYETW